MTSKLFPPSRKREIPLGFKIAATEVKRVLDRIFNPILKENLKDLKFSTLVDLEHESLPDENKELLRIWYSLEVQGEFNDKKEWDKITDIFYGYDEKYPNLKDSNIVPVARDYLNMMDIEGYNNWDYTTFEIRQSATAGTASKIALSKFDAANEMLPKADALDFSEYNKIEKDELLKLSHEDLIKNLISLYASEKKLPIPNPKKIKNTDVVFSLLSHNDEITIGLVKFISNFFGVPDHDDYNPLSEKYGPSINFCFRENRKAVIFVQDYIDFYEGMYGFKDRITENVFKDSDLKQEKIIDLDNYETEVKYLICKLLHALKIKNVDPKKLKMTDNIIMLANYNRTTAWSTIKSILAHFDVIGMSGGLPTDFMNQTNPTVEDAIDFAKWILEDSGSSYNEKHDLNIVKSELKNKNDNEDHAKIVLKKHGYGIKYISDRLRKNKNFIIELLKLDTFYIDEEDMQSIDDSLKDDKEVVELVLTKNFALYKSISSNLKKDKVFFKKVLKTHFEKEQFPSLTFDDLDESLRNDKEIVINILNGLIEKNSYFYDSHSLGSNLKKDKEIAKKVLQLEGSLKDFDKVVTSDKEIALTALKNDPINYKYLSENLKSDSEIFNIYKENVITKLNKKFERHWGNLDEKIKQEPEIKKIYDEKYKHYLTEIQVGNIDHFEFDIPRILLEDKKFFLDAIKIIKEDQLDQHYDSVKSFLEMSELAKDDEIAKVVKSLNK